MASPNDPDGPSLSARLLQESAAAAQRQEQAAQVRAHNAAWSAAHMPADIAEVDAGAKTIATLLTKAGVPTVPLFEAESHAPPARRGHGYAPVHLDSLVGPLAGWPAYPFNGYVLTDGRLVVPDGIAKWEPHHSRQARRVLAAQGVTRKNWAGHLQLVKAERWSTVLELAHTYGPQNRKLLEAHELVEELADLALSTRSLAFERDRDFEPIETMLAQALQQALNAHAAS
jgi:hypothetical protein